MNDSSEEGKIFSMRLERFLNLFLFRAAGTWATSRATYGLELTMSLQMRLY